LSINETERSNPNSNFENEIPARVSGRSIIERTATFGMKISGRPCYPKFSIGTLPKLHFIEAIRSAPRRDWLALIMPLWGAPGDPEVSSQTRFFVALQENEH